MSGQIIEHKTFDQERALYGSHGLTLRHCTFDGPADGESAVKECGDITAEDCFFNLRYPFWHVQGLTIRRSELTGCAGRPCGTPTTFPSRTPNSTASRPCGNVTTLFSKAATFSPRNSAGPPEM